MVFLKKWVITVYIFLSCDTVNCTKYRVWIRGAADKYGKPFERKLFMNSGSKPSVEKRLETILNKQQILELSSTQLNVGDVRKNSYYVCPAHWDDQNTWFEIDATKIVLIRDGSLVITYTRMLPMSQSKVQLSVPPNQEFWIKFSATNKDPAKCTMSKSLVRLGSNGFTEENSCKQNWSIQLFDQFVQNTGNGTLIFNGLEYDVFLYHDAVAADKPPLEFEAQNWKRMHIENILRLNNGKNQVDHIDFFIFGIEVWLLFEGTQLVHRGKKILLQGFVLETEKIIVAFHPNSNNFFIGKNHILEELDLFSQLKLEKIEIQRKFGLNDKKPDYTIWKRLILSDAPYLRSLDKHLHLSYTSF